MHDELNFTPLKPSGKTKKGKGAFFLLFSSLLLGVIAVALGINIMSIQKPLEPYKNKAAETISPTQQTTPTILLSPTDLPTPTPVPISCGTKGCDSTGNPCRAGSTCIQAVDGSNYCALNEFQQACRVNPSVTSCCSPPAATPAPLACGQKGCDNTNFPCSSGLTCIQANDGSNYCSFPEFQQTCKSTPSVNSCCTPTAPTNTPSPTEIILAMTTTIPSTVLSPTTTKTVTPTKTSSIPAAGVFKPWFVVIPLGAILLGLLL